MDERTIAANRERARETLDSFGGKRGARTAAFYMGTSVLLDMQMAPFFRSLPVERRLEMKTRIGADPYYSDRYGTWAKYRLGPLIAALNIASPDGTPYKALERSTFEIMDQLIPEFSRTPKTVGNSLERARPSIGFRKRLLEELKRMSKYGHVEIDEGREIVKRGDIIPELLMEDFWGDILGSAQSSFKRSLTTTKVGMESPRRDMITQLILSRHLGLSIGYKVHDFKRWWDLYGPTGIRFAFQGGADRVFLQYAKAGMSVADLPEEESVAYVDVRQAISHLPFVSKELLKEKFGIGYVNFVRAVSKDSKLGPIQIGDAFVSPELGRLLQWSSRDNLSLEQHPVRLTLTKLYNEVNPNAVEFAELGQVVRYGLSELAANGRFQASTPMEKKVMESLSPTYVNPLTWTTYEIVPGMEAQVVTLSRYTGNLFAGQRARTPKIKV